MTQNSNISARINVAAAICALLFTAAGFTAAAAPVNAAQKAISTSAVVAPLA